VIKRLLGWFSVGLMLGVVVALLFKFNILQFNPGGVETNNGEGDNISTEANKPPVQGISEQERSASIQDLTDNIYQSRRNGITDAIDKAAPAVVGITVKKVSAYQNNQYDRSVFRYFFGIPEQTYEDTESLGSGFIISSDGYIVSNEHVVHEASEITVTMPDGDSYKAELIGTDYDTDLALLKVDAYDLPHLNIAQDNSILIGEWAIAIGNPFGLFKINDQPSVSVGVVSAMGRNFERQEDGRLYRQMIQTDAAINPGNSGGPLLNILGEVIGVNTFIFTGGGRGSVGVGFALPAPVLREVVDELKQRGTINRDFWTGIYVQNLDRRIVYNLRYNSLNGVLITQLDENSPGQKAGLKLADIIMEIEGTSITDARVIRRYFDNHDLRVGDSLNMKLFRDGIQTHVTLILEARP
jgi:serine protease Do